MGRLVENRRHFQSSLQKITNRLIFRTWWEWQLQQRQNRKILFKIAVRIKYRQLHACFWRWIDGINRAVWTRRLILKCIRKRLQYSFRYAFHKWTLVSEKTIADCVRESKKKDEAMIIKLKGESKRFQLLCEMEIEKRNSTFLAHERLRVKLEFARKVISELRYRAEA